MNIQTSGAIEYNGIPSADYDECLMWSSPSDEQPAISGQFCSISIQDMLIHDYNKHISSMNDTLVTMAFDKITTRYLSGPVFTNGVKFNKKIFLGSNEALEWANKIKLTMPIGLCLPNTCSTKEIENVINKGKLLFLTLWKQCKWFFTTHKGVYNFIDPPPQPQTKLYYGA